MPKFAICISFATLALLLRADGDACAVPDVDVTNEVNVITQPAKLPHGCEKFSVERPRRTGGAIVHAVDFGFSVTNDLNATAIMRALDYCRTVGASRLELEPGEYRCFDQDHGLVISNMTDFTFEGKGATLVFRRPARRLMQSVDWMSPDPDLFITECLRCVIGGVQTDWDWREHPLCDVGVVVDTHVDEKDDSSYFDLELSVGPEGHPWYGRPMPIQTMTPINSSHDRLTGEKPSRLLFALAEGHFGTKMEWIDKSRIRVWPGVRQPGEFVAPADESLFAADRNRRMSGAMPKGVHYRIFHHYYGKNGLVLNSSRHVTLEDVHIISCFGMPMLVDGMTEYCQFIRVVSEPKKGRPCAGTSDGCHIARSRGHLKFIGCRLSMQNDDGFNWHDCFTLGVPEGKRRLRVTNLRGVKYFGAETGDELELLRANFSPCGWKGRLLATEGDCLLVDCDLPPLEDEHFLIFNNTYRSDHILMRDCVWHDTHAREIVQPSHVTVENCRFVRTGGGVKFVSAHSRELWCEGRGAHDIVVRGCTFEHTNVLADWNPEDDAPEFETLVRFPNKKPYPPGYNFNFTMTPPPGFDVGFHSDILIEKCRFIDPAGSLFVANPVKNLVFRDNDIVLTGVRQVRPTTGCFRFKNAEGVFVVSNRYHVAASLAGKMAPSVKGRVPGLVLHDNVLEVSHSSVSSPTSKIRISDDGLHLVREDDGSPTVLVATTLKWEIFDNKAPPQWVRYRENLAPYEWMYGTSNSVDKILRLGFNSMNAFALPTGYLPLLPGYVPQDTPEGDFAELLRLDRAFGWTDPAKKLNVLGFAHSPGRWSAAMSELRKLRDVPFYLDFHTPRSHRLSVARSHVDKQLDVPSLFCSTKQGSAFTQAFRLTSSAGRDAFIKMYLHDAQTYRKLGVRPWAYKLLNEPSYFDYSPELEAMVPKGLSKRGVAVERLKARERLMCELCVRAREELLKVESNMPMFIQLKATDWNRAESSVDLYSTDRAMEIISIGTGGYAYMNAEQSPAGTRFAAAGAPGQQLTEELGRMACYRALAHGKPLVASEAYFGGIATDRSQELEKMLAHVVAEGASMVNLWEWSYPAFEPTSCSYALSSAYGCRPATWEAFPGIVNRLNMLADFFPCGVRREKTRVACLFSNPTRRLDATRLFGYSKAVAALELSHIRADAIFEEQLPPGDDCRLGDYDVIVSAGVDATLETTDECLRSWLDRGGALILIDSPMDCDEHGEKRKTSLAGSGHPNIVRMTAHVPFFERAVELRKLLAKCGIFPIAEVTDVLTGETAPFVRIFRADNGKGMIAYMLANYSDTPRLVSVRAPSVGPAVISPHGTNRWPVVDGAIRMVVPAQSHAFAVCGSLSDLESRFGAKTEVSAADLRSGYEHLAAETAARAPRRPSVPIPLSAVANGGFDNQQGWAADTVWKDAQDNGLKGVPYHGCTYRHIDFDVIRFDFNENRTTVALRSAVRKNGLAHVTLPLEGRTLRGIAFLHAAIGARTGETAYTIEVRFANGEKVRQEMRVGTEIGSWRIADNPSAVQNACVWKNSEGKGFFLYEWENPCPSEPLAEVTLTGGGGRSAANVLAVSALPTVFVSRYARRLDLLLGDPMTLGKADSHTFAPKAGTVWPLGGEALTNGVLRFEISNCADENGAAPQFGQSSTSVTGRLSDGKIGRTDPHSLTEARTSLIGWMRRSVASPEEWAEVELPLSRITTGMNASGALERFGNLESLTIHYLAHAPHRYRNVRIEWDPIRTDFADTKNNNEGAK